MVLFAVDSSGNIYAGTNDGLYKSSDGNTFTKINDKLNASVNDIAIQKRQYYQANKDKIKSKAKIYYEAKEVLTNKKLKTEYMIKLTENKLMLVEEKKDKN